MTSRIAIILILTVGSAFAADEPTIAAGGDQVNAFANLSEAEYELSQQGGIWEAPNRGNEFRTRFESSGIRLRPRTDPAIDSVSPWEWALSLIGVGRPGDVADVQPAIRRIDDRRNRIEYDRGTVVEWYVNDDSGLEQGFTLAAPPSPDRGEVALDLALDSTLQPSFSADGRAIDFTDDSGASVLRYAKLVVLDSRGETLPARMEGFVSVNQRGIRILFDDSDAVYPVTVDPLVTTAAWTGESNQPSAWYGYSVATAGDVNGDGYSDVIVGAPAYDNGQGDEGRAYVYYGSPNGLAAAAAWTAESDEADALFGWSVATAGDVNGDGYDDVLVGAYAASNGHYQEGRAYLYYGSLFGLSSTPGWTAEGDQDVAYFGTSVATAGDVNGDGNADVVIGAPGYTNGQAGEGRAYVYLGSTSGLGQTPAWIVESDSPGAAFGGAVATAGDVDGDGYADVIVGAPSYDSGTFFNAGAAFLYHGSPSGLSQTPGWSVVSGQTGGEFGNSVSTAGDLNGDGYADIVVGEYERDIPGQQHSGRILIYYGSSAGVSTSVGWTINGSLNSRCGVSVATAGDLDGDGYADIVYGCNRAPDVLGQVANIGLVDVWKGSPTGLTRTTLIRGTQAGGQLGISVATAGDVNGDGFSDVIYGAYLFDNGQIDEGRAFLHYGRPEKQVAGIGAGGQAIVGPPSTGSAFGTAASAGDINGDGFSDVVVGAPWSDNVGTNSGSAYMHLGSAIGLSTSADWAVDANQASAEYGTSVGVVGDVNGDGYDDVIVGAPYFSNGENSSGKAFVYLGSPSGLPLAPSWTADGDGADSRFGLSVAGAGDVNGDGYADVIVGAPGYAHGQVTEGGAFLYLGSASGLAATPAWSAESDQEGAWFGTAVSTAGDVNGDGYSDVIVGAKFAQNTLAQEGRAYVYLGSPSGLSALPAWIGQSGQAGARYGSAVTWAGDVNGDGFSDVLVGAPFFDVTGSNAEGRAYLYFGSAAGLGATPSWIADGSTPNSIFTSSVACVGDIDGDGYSDIALGSDNRAAPRVYSGSVIGPGGVNDVQLVGYYPTTSPSIFHLFPGGDVDGDGFADLLLGFPGSSTLVVYYGNLGSNSDRQPRQMRTDGITRLAPGGSSDSETAFDVSMLGRTAAGRGKVRAIVEAKPLGVPFGGTGWISSPMQDTGSPGVDGSAVSFDETVTGLAEGRSYRWRVRTVSPDPFFPRSPWFSAPGNNVTEKKLRTAGCVDADGDGYGALGDASCLSIVADCSDQSAARWALPGETRNLRFLSKSTLSWEAPAEPGAIASELVYDTMISSSPADFSSPACLESNDGTDTTATDGSTPLAGQTYYYLIRTQNSCPPDGLGTLGTTSGGAERAGADCS